ncbi:hypothetical protein FJY68_05240 [candidate division WOR-3 bacterium]|uniref:Glycosyltransferase RgtA/B/C/D-like domain-containing protein n=1 Tax=candidate division WOR-3 bacterium TaxID=2052148 RepID=A0A938BSZ6_UNCW3|nr:hypothetical protein [candidate division WOR-3 bacterium]
MSPPFSSGEAGAETGGHRPTRASGNEVHDIRRPGFGEPARSALVLSCLFVAVVVLTNPLGDFPLNDDWSYGQAVRNLVSNHEYRLANWTSMPLLTQVLWGALFTVPAGFSFTALRVSTLFLSLAALLLLLLLSLTEGERPLPALLAPLLLLFSPVFLNLSHTFMTDIPFIALTLGSILLLSRGADRENRFLLGLGMCVAIMATLLRQTGMLIPVAFGISSLCRGRATAREVMLSVGLSLLTIVAYVVYTLWLARTGRLPTGYFAQWTQIRAIIATGPSGIAGQAARSLLITCMYLGIFTLPFGLLFVSRTHAKRLLLLLLMSAVLIGIAYFCRVTLPGNILSDRGVGPFTLARPPEFAIFSGSPAAKAVLGLLTLLGSALLLEMLVRSTESALSSRSATVCLSLAGLYLVSLSLVHQFDRYMVFYLPLLLAPATLALREHPPGRLALVGSLVATLAYAAFSVSSVHDYMAWNRVRWQAIRHLTRTLEVPAERIDGGFEFNGLYTYSENHVRKPGSSPWWVKDNQYVIAFGVLPGYRTLKSYAVQTWLPSGIKRIYILARADWTPYSARSLDFEAQSCKLAQAHGAILRDGGRFRRERYRCRNAA